jgi:NTE family protein
MSIPHFSRRCFLNLVAATIPSVPLLWSSAVASEKQQSTRTVSSSRSESGDPKIGIALGAGGANGLSHILMLEVLDEMEITPYRISGSSIGAIVGALYASGMTAKQIRKMVEQFIISPKEQLVDELMNKDTLRWIDFLDIELGQGGLLNSENFASFLYDSIQYDTFEALKIPLSIVAGDLWHYKQVILKSGALLPAVKASMALPGVFQPVMLDGHTLVDGGTVNPVPYDLLIDDCDIVIGIDVIGERTLPQSGKSSYLETIFNSVKIMQYTIMAEKRRRNKPDIYITPKIVDIHALEFYRAEQVFAQALPAKEELKEKLTQLLRRI